MPAFAADDRARLEHTARAELAPRHEYGVGVQHAAFPERTVFADVNAGKERAARPDAHSRSNIDKGVDSAALAQLRLGRDGSQRADAVKGALRHGKHADGAGKGRVGLLGDQGIFHFISVFGAHDDCSGPGRGQLRRIFGVGQKAQFGRACFIQRIHAGDEDILALKAQPQRFGNTGKRIACHGGSFADFRRAGRARKQREPGCAPVRAGGVTSR